MSSVPPPGSWPDLPELPEGVTPSGPPIRRTSRDGDAPAWAPWTAIVALLAAFAMAFMGAILIAIVSTAFGGDVDDPGPAVNIAATLLQDAAFIGAALLFARRAGRILPTQFGMRTTPLWAAVGWTALALVGFYVLSALWVALTGTDETSELPSEFGVEQSTAAFVAVCILVTVVAPVAEEVFFRGYFYGALRNWRGPWLAAVLTGLVFGGIHAGSTPVVFLVPLAILGLFLCLLRERTGSLLPCMAAHALNNAIAFGVAEADWDAWQVILLIVGANAAILLGSLPFLRKRVVAPVR